MFVGTQPERLPYLFQSVDISGGLIPRCCVFGWKKSPPEYKQEDAAFRELALKSLRMVDNAMSKAGDEVKVEITSNAIDMVFAEQNRLQHDILDDRVRGCYARALDPLFKLSLLYWLNEATNDDTDLTTDLTEESGSSTSLTSLHNKTNSNNSNEYIYVPQPYISNPLVSNYVYHANLSNLSNLSNLPLACQSVTGFHVAKSIALYRTTLPWVQKLAESASSSIEEKNIILLSNMCRSLALRGHASEIPDGNGGVVFALDRSVILRNCRMSASTLNKYLETLVGRSDVIGKAIIYSESGSGKKTTYYPILRPGDD
jgi:hypothetical protein